MPCNPGDQLYDCQRPPGTNRQVFHARDGMVTEVTSNGLEEGQEIPILVRDETGEYVPYEIDGQPVVLTAENPSVLIDEKGWYQLDTSGIECPEDATITVEAEERPSNVSTSSIACFTDESGESRYVEIVRYSDGQDPVIYEIGTGVRIVNPVGTFTENCCDCENGGGDSQTCVSCETIIMCDTVNDPDPTAGIPWNVVEIEEDADDPEHILHYHMSPADDPTKVGVVTFQSSTPFNTGGCEFPDVDYAISNPSRRTITLDEVAQEMHAFQFNMIDFDTFEPTYIPTGFPIPTRLGGTAYWTGEPGNNVNILPTESDGTGLLIWDNPPETLAIQVGNTGGGNSCSNVDFEALTLSTMNRSFLRTICRNCDGDILSVTDTEMDGETPYEPVGEVVVCGENIETAQNDNSEEWVSVIGSAFHYSPTGAGQTEAGLVSVSITNVGESNGLVYNSDIVPNQTITFSAYENPVTKEFVTLPAIPYDSTGTTLSITTQG